MKRINGIYEKISTIENIELAIKTASKGKTHRKSVAQVIGNMPVHARAIKDMLDEERYISSLYTVKEIIDNSSFKRRTIHVPKFFPDQIIHWALMLQIQSVIMRGMYHYSCGTVPGRGQSHGHKALRKWLDTDRKNTKYCLKMDISKYYHHVDQDILMGMFRKVLKDTRTISLIESIVKSVDKGLPIGNFTSQWFANFYLQDVDHFIKQRLGIKYYIRYVDDLVLLGPNKKKLHHAKRLIEEMLGGKGLSVKGDWQVFPVASRPIDFLGYKFYRNRTTMRSTNSLRVRRKALKVARATKPSFKDSAALMSYVGFADKSDCYKFKLKYFSGIDFEKVKEVIRNESRKQYQARESESRTTG